MIKAYKVRLFPTEEQMEKIWQNIGASRFVWNYMLELQNKRYKDGEKHLGHFDMVKVLTELKKQDEYAWLKDADSKNANITCKDLDGAFKKFFKKQGGYPKFKSKKKSKASYPTNYERVDFYDNYVQLPKLGRVKYKSEYDMPLGKDACKFTNPRISVTTKGKVILSFGMEYEPPKIKLNDYDMGIDLGIKDLAVVACGDNQVIYHNFNKSREMKQLTRKLKHLQRNVARKYRTNGSWEKTNNIKKEEKKIKELSEHIANKRLNYIHHMTRELVNMKPKRIVIEDLNVSGMMKNKHLSKAVQQASFYEIRRQIEYKSEWMGIEVVLADRFFPSSKTCHKCGYVHKGLRLKDRTYVCPECGYAEDRDINAAMNLRDYLPNDK